MNITLVASLMAAVAGFLTGAGLAWQLQAGNITEMELNHANERMAIQRAARATLERSMSQVAAAQAAAAKRSVRVRVDSAGSRNAAGGLRIATEAAVRSAADDPATCSHTAASLGELFTESITAYRELAETADRHASDIQLMQDAWQK